jgi:phage terminase Nu1 subunit (DNA packaging protein)
MARAIKSDEVVSGPVLAKRLGLTATSVSRLAANGVVVRKGRGKYLAWASARAYIGHVSKTNRASPASVARAKLLDIQAQRQKFAMEREMGGWCREADVCADVREAFRIVRDGMMRVPARMAADSPHLTRADIMRLEDSTRAVLTELGAEGERIVREIQDAKTALETG